MGVRGGVSFWIPAGLLGLVLALIIVFPLLSLQELVFGAADPIPTSKSAGELFVTTLILSVSVIASLVGSIAGVGLFVLPSKVRGLFLYLSMTAFFIPAYVYAVAWIELLQAKGRLASVSSFLYLPTLEVGHLFSLPGTVAVSDFDVFGRDFFDVQCVSRFGQWNPTDFRGDCACVCGDRCMVDIRSCANQSYGVCAYPEARYADRVGDAACGVSWIGRIASCWRGTSAGDADCADFVFRESF